MIDIDSLSDSERSVIRAIVGAPLAWASKWLISRRARCRSGPVLDRLASGSNAWVVRWARASDGRPLRLEVWTLTPWGAHRMGVWVDEEEEGKPKWYSVKPEIEPRCKPEFPVLPFPERVPDKRQGPEYVVDIETGETSTDENEAMKVCGVPVVKERKKNPKKSRKR